MLFPALALTLLSAAPIPEARKQQGFDAIGVPLLSFNTDQGVGYGAVGGAYFYAPGYKPYRHGIALQTFFSTRGVQNHWLRYDGPKLFGNSRLEVRAEFRRELLTPYYGPGNLATPDFNYDLDDKRYAFDRLSPGAWVRIRNSPFGETHPFQPYVGLGYRHTRVKAFEDSLLVRDRPLGIEGGGSAMLMGGLIWDTRDDEADTSRGGIEEISLRVSSDPAMNRYRYGGVTLSERRFWQLGTRRLIFAQRVSADFMFGEVPFYEWSGSGGLQNIEGVGGMGSVRGVSRNRYSGNAKAFSNSELRFYPYEFPLFKEEVRVGGLVFADIGRVWHPGVDDGPWYAFHTGVGGGLRLARRAAVLRFDYAFAPEALRHGVYVAFGHMF